MTVGGVVVERGRVCSGKDDNDDDGEWFEKGSMFSVLYYLYASIILDTRLA